MVGRTLGQFRRRAGALIENQPDAAHLRSLAPIASRIFCGSPAVYWMNRARLRAVSTACA